jgi:hypothetical protein
MRFSHVKLAGLAVRTFTDRLPSLMLSRKQGFLELYMAFSNDCKILHPYSPQLKLATTIVYSAKRLSFQYHTISSVLQHIIISQQHSDQPHGHTGRLILIYGRQITCYEWYFGSIRKGGGV